MKIGFDCTVTRRSPRLQRGLSGRQRGFVSAKPASEVVDGHTAKPRIRRLQPTVVRRLVQAVAPRFGMKTLFGEEVTASPALLIIRSWGAMIFVSGLLLMYAAYHADQRLPILFYSITVKVGVAGLVFASGAPYRTRQIFKIAAADFVMALLLLWYLIASY
jgi:hypothetical protein